MGKLNRNVPPLSQCSYVLELTEAQRLLVRSMAKSNRREWSNRILALVMEKGRSSLYGARTAIAVCVQSTTIVGIHLWPHLSNSEINQNNPPAQSISLGIKLKAL